MITTVLDPYHNSESINYGSDSVRTCGRKGALNFALVCPFGRKTAPPAVTGPGRDRWWKALACFHALSPTTIHSVITDKMYS